MMYFDDFPVGYRFETGTRTLPLNDIMSFARDWDPQPFHIDPDAAEKSTYGGIIASGFQTILIGFLLSYQTGLWSGASMGSPGMDSIRWLHPVRPGDSLRVEAEVIASTPSASRPDRGRILVRNQVFNQNDVCVAEFTGTHILKRQVLPSG